MKKITLIAADSTCVTWTACTNGMEFGPGQGPAATDGSLRHQIIEVTGFNPSGAGSLTGPDGNLMDTESFLASLNVVADVDIVDPAGKVILAVGDSIPFRLMTQKYGKGIVDYGQICSADGKLYKLTPVQIKR